MKFRVLILCLCGTLFFTGSVPILASEIRTDYTDDVMPLMTYIDSAIADLSISSDGMATVKSAIYGINGITTNVAISARIERYQNGHWITVRIFDKNSSLFYLILSEQCQVSKGYTYRVVANVRVSTSSGTEGRTVVSNEVKY